MVVKPPATEEDLLATPKDGRKYELVDGEIVVSPAGMRHEGVIDRLQSRIHRFLQERMLGRVFGSNLGLRLPGGNVRSPDLTFVGATKLPAGELPESFAEVVPDLAVEVLSPGDRPRDVADKIGEYLQAGVPLVWVVEPRERTVTVYRSLTDTEVLRARDRLTGGAVLPGFTCGVEELFQ